MKYFKLIIFVIFLSNCTKEKTNSIVNEKFSIEIGVTDTLNYVFKDGNTLKIYKDWFGDSRCKVEECNQNLCNRISGSDLLVNILYNNKIEKFSFEFASCIFELDPKYYYTQTYINNSKTLSIVGVKLWPYPSDTIYTNSSGSSHKVTYFIEQQ
jgi:hypothetical protein